VVSRHHQIVEVGRIETAERHRERPFVAFVPLPVLEPEVVLLVAGVMQAERPGVLDHGVGKLPVAADVVLGEDIVADVAPELALAGDVAHPVQCKIGVRVGLETLDVRERSVDGAQQVVADMLRLGVRVE
jgi:hypothetical protein